MCKYTFNNTLRPIILSSQFFTYPNFKNHLSHKSARDYFYSTIDIKSTENQHDDLKCMITRKRVAIMKETDMTTMCPLLVLHKFPLQKQTSTSYPSWFASVKHSLLLGFGSIMPLDFVVSDSPSVFSFS